LSRFRRWRRDGDPGDHSRVSLVEGLGILDAIDWVSILASNCRKKREFSSRFSRFLAWEIHDEASKYPEIGRVHSSRFIRFGHFPVAYCNPGVETDKTRDTVVRFVVRSGLVQC